MNRSQRGWYCSHDLAIKSTPIPLSTELPSNGTVNGYLTTFLAYMVETVYLKCVWSSLSGDGHAILFDALDWVCTSCTRGMTAMLLTGTKANVLRIVAILLTSFVHFDPA